MTRAKQANGAATVSDDSTSTASPLLPDDSLRKLYKNMLRSRLYVEAFPRLRLAGIAVNECALGLEATQVTPAIDLVPQDSLAPTSRDSVIAVSAGTPLNAVIKRLRSGKKATRGEAKPAITGRTTPHLITPTANPNADLNIATGVALAYRLLKRRNVVVAFTDGLPKDTQLWRETLNIAADQKLPIVYVVVTEPSDSTADSHERSWADPNAIPTIVVDGNDPIAVYRVAHEAIDHARSGGGPTVMECETRRWHSDTPSTGNRNQSETPDPIPHLERFLTKRGLWTEQWKRELIAEIDRELTQALEGAKAKSR
jgi:TPP-dependent pyruvate/acetoin dehydrogenase alpha subunit